MLWLLDVDVTGSGCYPMADFHVTDIEVSGFATRELIRMRILGK
jgi:hypothetical protein